MQNFNPRVSGLFLLCLVLVYIVILAGGTVRATGAGMGCPDGLCVSVSLYLQLVRRNYLKIGKIFTWFSG